jgi:hypothetical protein
MWSQMFQRMWDSCCGGSETDPGAESLQEGQHSLQLFVDKFVSETFLRELKLDLRSVVKPAISQTWGFVFETECTHSCDHEPFLFCTYLIAAASCRRVLSNSDGTIDPSACMVLEQYAYIS